MLGSKSIQGLSGIVSGWGLIQKGGGGSLNGAGEKPWETLKRWLYEGASAIGQKKSVTIIPTERSKISLSSCLERIKSLKSDFFYVVAICLDEILKVSIFLHPG